MAVQILARASMSSTLAVSSMGHRRKPATQTRHLARHGRRARARRPANLTRRLPSEESDDDLTVHGVKAREDPRDVDAFLGRGGVRGWEGHGVRRREGAKLPSPLNGIEDVQAPSSTAPARHERVPPAAASSATLSEQRSVRQELAGCFEVAKVGEPRLTEALLGAVVRVMPGGHAAEDRCKESGAHFPGKREVQVACFHARAHGLVSSQRRGRAARKGRRSGRASLKPSVSA